jgi:competence protein ComEA
MAVVCAAAAMMALVVAGFWLSTRDDGSVSLERGDAIPQTSQQDETTQKASDGVRMDWTSKDQQTSASGDATASPTVTVVHVDGAVTNPGVYTLQTSSPRVIDAVEMAGGLCDDAKTDTINLAAPVGDGAKVHIPREGEEAIAGDAPVTDGGVPNDEGSASSGGTASVGSGDLVNINTADAEQLKTLSGIGDATAAAIIEDRDQQGPFATPEDLMRVSGIGEKKFAKIKDKICV